MPKKISEWQESVQRFAKPAPGCSPQIAMAIKTFVEKWGPYSVESRRYSIFRLMHDLIDPAWADLCKFFFVDCKLLDHAWERYQWPEKFMPYGRLDEHDKNIKYAVEQNKRASIPCRGTINGRYILSDIARYHGFDALDRFLQELYRACHNQEGFLKPTLGASIDSLRNLAMLCRDKRSKMKSAQKGAVNFQRDRFFTVCRLCGQETEISSCLNGNISCSKDDIAPKEQDRLSTQYCSLHRPKERYAENVVRASYRTAKRNQKKFQQELSRLHHQCWGWLTRKPQANSGNVYVDVFIHLLINYHRLGLDDEHDATNDIDQKRLRDEARNLLDQKISDRKKEIVALLALGNNQSSIANQLGITRSAVSQLLRSIPKEYRLDILLLSPPVESANHTGR
jgi:predicted XRE-type DNA-binding protein